MHLHYANKKDTVVHKEEILSWKEMTGICQEHNEPEHRNACYKKWNMQS